MRISVFLFALLALCMLHVQSQTHVPDPNFGVGGIVKTAFHENINYSSDGVTKVFQLLDGKALWVMEGNGFTILSRRFSNGQLDLSYGEKGYSTAVNFSQPDAQMDANGKVVISGFASGPVQYAGFGVARFNEDGSLDKTFSGDGIATRSVGNNAGSPRALSIQPDNSIIVAGMAHISGKSHHALVKFRHDGTIDESFGNKGESIFLFGQNDYIYDGITQADGKIVVSGSIYLTVNGVPGNQFSVVRYNPNGTLDSTFATNGKLTFYGTPAINGDFAQALALQKDGKILASGGYTDFFMARLHTDGSLDSSFDVDGKLTTDFGLKNESVQGLAIQADGKIVAIGTTWTYNVTPIAFAVARYNPDGSPDKSFGTDGKLVTDIGMGNDNPETVTITDDQSILVAGSTYSGNDDLHDFAIAKYRSHGALDPTFGDNGKLIGHIDFTLSGFQTIEVQNDKKILVGGYSESSFSTSNFVLARYNEDGQPDASFGTSGKVITVLPNHGSGIVALSTANNTITAVGLISPGNMFHLAKYSQNGAPDPSFGQSGIATIDPKIEGASFMRFGFYSDNKIIAVGYRQVSATRTDLIVQRYAADGSLDLSFNNGLAQFDLGVPRLVPVAVTILANGSIVVLSRAGAIGSFDFVLVKLNSNGSLDTNFGTQGKAVIDFGGNDAASHLLVQGNEKMIVFGTQAASGNNKLLLAQVNKDGSVDPGFGSNGKVITEPSGRYYASTACLQADNKIVLSASSTSDVSVTSNLSDSLKIFRYNSDGSIDSSFGQLGKAASAFYNNIVLSAAVSNDKLYLAGRVQSNVIATYASITSYQMEAPIRLTCPGSVATKAEEGTCSAVVTTIDPTLEPNGDFSLVRYTLTGATSGSGTGSVSGKTFNTGVTTVNYYLANDTTQSCSFTITVNDDTAPVLTTLKASEAALWPPDHQMVAIQLDYEITDNCGVLVCTISVSSNEPQNGLGDGDVDHDWEIIDNKNIRLRAERAGTGEGRMYTIKLECTDAAGNVSTKTTFVSVPKGQLESKGHPNPSATEFIISTKSIHNQPLTIRVMASNGHVIETRTNVSPNSTLKLGQNYLPGIYTIEIIQGADRQTLMVVKL